LHFYVAASEDPWGTTVFEKDAVSSSSRQVAADIERGKSQLRSVGAPQQGAPTTTHHAKRKPSSRKPKKKTTQKKQDP
jgi:hypothetical protein